MANPQVENGHTDISNEIMDALARTRIPGEARQVLDLILRRTYGWHKKEDIIPLSQFSAGTGLSKNHICRAIKTLIKMNLITQKGYGGVPQKGNSIGKTYAVIKNFDVWVPVPQKGYQYPNKGIKGTPIRVTSKAIKESTTTAQPEKQVERVLTSIQELIEAYKTVKGFNDIPDWNKINFGRFTKDAKNILLMVKGDLKVAVSGVKRIARKLDNKNLSWNLSTVVRMFPDWLIERSKEDYDTDCEND